MNELVVDGGPLTVEDVVAVARGETRVRLAADVPERMEVSRSVVLNALRGGAPVYGVNTGFGALADTPVGEQDLTTLQGAIVRSHAAGIGAPLDDEVVLPGMVVPLETSQPEVGAAIDAARTPSREVPGMRSEVKARVLLVPRLPDRGLAGVGTLALVEQVGRLPGGQPGACGH